MTTNKNQSNITSPPSKRGWLHSFRVSLKKNWSLYLLITPVIIFFLLFSYWPMAGLRIAFQNYNPAMSAKAPITWVGLAHFKRFFSSIHFTRVLQNTIGISVYSLIVGFPLPIILAIMLNEVSSKKYKSFVQTVTYAPHFISTVVLCSMVRLFLNPNYGFINMIIAAFGNSPISFMVRPEWFKTIYVLSGVWQSTGWGAIVYIAALSGLDMEMFEAAQVDGVNTLQKIWYLTLPCLMPTAVLLLILNFGSIMNVGFEKVFLLQTDLNRSASDVISTFVYRVGLEGAEFSYATAIGLFNSAINFILLVIVNKISKKLSDISLF